MSSGGADGNYSSTDKDNTYAKESQSENQIVS